MLYPGEINPADATPISMRGLTVQQIYDGQKQELAATIRRALEAAFPLDFDVQAIARLMHNLAGTSSYFGESHIGECALLLENRLRTANSADAIKALCSQMLAELG